MDKLTEELKAIGVLKKGTVVLTSGRKADFYIDLKLAHGHPKVLRLMTDGLSKYIDKETTCVAGIGYGGLPLVTAIALKNNLKSVFVRKEPKKHGTSAWIDGYVPSKKDRVVIVDDVLTTGGSIEKINIGV